MEGSTKRPSAYSQARRGSTETLWYARVRSVIERRGRKSAMVALGWPIALSMYPRSRSRLHICRKSSQPISVSTAARSLPSYLWSGRTLHGGVRASPHYALAYVLPFASVTALRMWMTPPSGRRRAT